MANWKLTDSSTGSPVEFTFEHNPSSAQYPGVEGNLTEEFTTTGLPVLFAGPDTLPRMRFDGFTRTDTFYKNLKTWAQKRYVLTLEDDIGNSWVVIILSFTPARIRRPTVQWRFDFTIEMVVLDETLV